MTAESILVPLDGSNESETVLPYAVALARAEGRGILLLRVIEPDQTNAWLLRPGLDDELVEALFDAAQHYVDRVARSLERQGVDVRGEVLSGVPAEVIGRIEKERPVSMVAMATHGHGGFGRWALGSVADTVMRTASLPTFLLRPAESAGAGPSVQFNRLLVPLDGSKIAEAALDSAASLAGAAGPKLILLRVEPWAGMVVPYPNEAIDFLNLLQLDRAAEASARQYLDRVSRGIRAGISCERAVVRGDAGIMIEEFAKANQIDLVVMSTHGRGGLKRLLAGSRADALVRGGIPTLLVRPCAAASLAHRTPEEMVARPRDLAAQHEHPSR